MIIPVPLDDNLHGKCPSNSVLGGAKERVDDDGDEGGVKPIDRRKTCIIIMGQGKECMSNASFFFSLSDIKIHPMDAWDLPANMA